MTAGHDVLVVGELNADVVVAGDDLTPAFGEVERLVDRTSLTLGASGAIFACAAARLGLSVAYVGRVGDDPVGRFVLGALRDGDVDIDACRIDEDLPTGITVVLAQPGDRAILTALGTTAALTADDVPAGALEAARHVHVASYYLQRGLQPGVPDLFARARSSGATTSLDTNWDPTQRWADGLQAALDQTDIFMPNAAEAMSIAGVDDAAGALDVLGEQVRTVAIKLGQDGAVARRGSERARAAPPLVDVVDTTGAGDTFGAGLLAGLLRGCSLADSLSLATACGALATRALGGTGSQPTLAEAAAAAGIRHQTMEV